ncbi:Hypothetical predicted protein [Octopus vulgaris]|uniref:Uncharacterized protein n=1 Tax=Octopus vulgaris TaxID=6645 RepID=A0AA36F4M5_OCTVU|nr:Hypothetical predicted protein [Octopus vulgaris]
MNTCRTAKNSSTYFIPYQILYNKKATLPVELQHIPTAKDRDNFGNDQAVSRKIDVMTAIRDSMISRDVSNIRIAEPIQKEQCDRKYEQQQFSIGNKVLLLRNAAQVLIGTTKSIIEKLIREKGANNLKFEDYVNAMRQNKFIQIPSDGVIRRSKSLSSWYSGISDGRTLSNTARRIESWYKGDLVGDKDVYEAAEINLEDFKNLVSTTGAAIQNFETFFYVNKYLTREVVNFGILRYPEPKKPYFQQATLPVELQHIPTAKNRDNFGNDQAVSRKIDVMTAIRDSMISRDVSNIRIAEPIQKEQCDRKYEQQQISIGNKVLLKNLIREDRKEGHFMERRTGPYTVAEV